MVMAPRALRWLCVAACAMGPLITFSPARASGRQAFFVPAANLPTPLRNAIRAYLMTELEVVSTERYVREARRRGLRPGNPDTVLRVARGLGVDVVIVSGWAPSRRQLTLSLVHARSGRELRRIRHRQPTARLTDGLLEEVSEALRQAPNSRPRDSSQDGQAVQDEAGAQDRASVAARRDRSGSGAELPDPVDWDSEDTEEPLDSSDVVLDDDEIGSAQVGDASGESSDAEVHDSSGGSRFLFSAAVGAGFGMRSVEVPTGNGPATLSALPFPALLGGMRVGIRPIDGSSITLHISVAYLSSVGFSTENLGEDGSSVTVGARAERVAPQLEFGMNLAEGDWQPHMRLALGWAFRMFSTDQPIVVPAFNLSGPYLSSRFVIPFGESVIALTVAPEAGLIVTSNEELSDLSQTGLGFSVSGEVGIQLTVLRSFVLDFTFRESHAFVTSDLAGQVKDVERWGLLRATYYP